MNREPDIEDDEPEDGYEPIPVSLPDGDAVIFDPIEFGEITNSIASMVVGGHLLVLDRTTLQWTDVIKLRTPEQKKLKPV